MATYEQLEYSSFTDVVVPFVTDNGLGVTDTGTATLTGYTLPNTKFTFRSDPTTLENTYIGPSLDKILWDMGDGTFLTGPTVTKQYDYPGDYEIFCVFTDQNGVTHKNTRSQKIKVMNYMPDALVWYTPTIVGERGGDPQRIVAGVPSDPLTVYRMNSWQTWPAVSADGGYYINLYSSGSKSRPLTTKQYWSNPETHFIPTWRFVETPESTVPVERVQTQDNDYVYVKVVDNEIVHTTNIDIDATFAGTSGRSTFHYIDDSATKLTSARDTTIADNTSFATYENESDLTGSIQDIINEAKDPILYASFDTSKFSLRKDDEILAVSDVFKESYFQIYMTQKIGLPIQVRFNQPTQIEVSSNGIRGNTIGQNKFIGSPMSVSVRSVNDEGYPVNSSLFPEFKSRWSAETQHFSGGDITTDTLTAQGYITAFLSGSDTKLQQIKTPFFTDEDFKRWDIGALYPENEASKIIRVIVAERRTKQPLYPEHDRNNAVTIPFNQLIEEDQDILMSDDKSAFGVSTNLPRLWRTKNNLDYYGYISPDSTYDDETAIDFEFVDHDKNFPTPGAFVGFANLKDTADLKINPGDKYRLYVETLVDPPKTFTYDVPYYYVTNPVNDTIWQLKPSYYRTYSYGDAGLTQSYTAPISTTSPGNSGMYGLAVDPFGHMIAVDGDTDKIIRYWRDMELRTERAIGDILPDELTHNKFPNDPEAYGYTPSSVCLDGNFDYWVSMYDSVSAVKFSGETDEILAYAAPNERNIIADSRTTNPSSYWTEDAEYQMNERGGREGEYGEYIINPGMVETCRDNSIVVTYTNPLCSFIMKYDSNGTPLYKYEITQEDGSKDHSRYFTGDMCIDVSDHVWAVTESTGLRPDGKVDLGIPKSAIYTFDEQMNLRYSVSSLAGTKYYDMLQPPPPEIQYISVNIEMQQRFNFDTQEDEEIAILVPGYGSAGNPTITLYEGNVYTFVNMFYMDGKHKLSLREITPDQFYEMSPNYVPINSKSGNFDITGNTLYSGVNGYERSDGIFSIHVTEDTPRRFLLIDENFPDILKLQVIVKYKPKAVTRPANTFEIINNASHLTPDIDNNIWFSWGNRFVSKWNPLKFKVDTTVAVGSAAPDPRYHPLSAETYDRRDNAGRESAIQGIATDTANNIVVINNFDKRVYSISSESPSVSGFIDIPSTAPEPVVFDWDDSMNNTELATRDDFMLYPHSHLTKEQVEVFLKGAKLEDEQLATGLNRAYLEYVATITDQNGDVNFRTAHALGGSRPVGYNDEICAYGDWTGFRWINKYDNNYVPSDATTGFARLSGVSDEFSVWTEQTTPEVVKVNENEDFAGIMRTYMTHPALQRSRILHDDIMNNVFGTTGSSVSLLGKRIYEKITNYVMNHSDVDTCTVRSLVGLAHLVGYEVSRVGYPIPPEMTRLIDILSINVGKLRGNVLLDIENFERYGNWAQDANGHNLGSEIMFVYDWSADLDYNQGDFVQLNGEYYQTVVSVHAGSNPEQSDDWVHWPQGYVRSQHKSIIDRLYAGKDEQWRDERYNKLPILIKLTQNLRVSSGEKYVLHNEHDNIYTLVDIMMISYRDGKEYKLEMDYSDFTGYKVKNPNEDRELKGERMSLFDDTLPMYVVEDNVLTLIGDQENSTISLLRNRTYQFEIDSVGHPVIITETPGASAEPTKYVADQNVEFGTIILQTNDDPVFGPIPNKLYYQSEYDPTVGGVIELTTPENIDGYSTQYDGLTSYNINISLSAAKDYNRMGWGVNCPANNNIWQHYSLYEYVETDDQKEAKTKYVGNVIDWSTGSGTTVSYNMSSNSDWFDVGAIADLMIEKQLRTGLDLFNGLESQTK